MGVFIHEVNYEGPGGWLTLCHLVDRDLGVVIFLEK